MLCNFAFLLLFHAAMQHMGVEYTRVSNFSKAIEWIKKSLDLQQQQNPPHHLNIADGLITLGVLTNCVLMLHILCRIFVSW